MVMSVESKSHNHEIRKGRNCSSRYCFISKVAEAGVYDWVKARKLNKVNFELTSFAHSAPMYDA